VGVTVGANRIVAGVRIPHVFGDPGLPPETEKTLRRKIVMAALKAVETEVTGPTVFSVDS
jgi:glycine reductase